MKYKLPSLTATFSLLVLLTIATQVLADPPQQPLDGNALIADAAANLANFPAFEAKLRQRVRLFGHEMVGAGTYLQMTAGRQRMFRLELKMDVAGQVASFQQISDGTTLWIRRDLGNEQSVEYLNLRQLRQEINRGSSGQAAPRTGTWFAMGGLDQLLNELNRNFAFAAPTPGQIGSVPVWELQGVWKKTALASLGFKQADDLPSHLPQIAKVTLGRDEQLPLFPYQIEYGRNSEGTDLANSKTTESSRYKAIAAMDVHGLQHRSDLTAAHFSFQPNNQEVIDVTDRFVSRYVARRSVSER